MKQFTIFLTILLLSQTFSSQSQNMNNKDLEKIIYVVSDSLKGITGNWQFVIENTLLICITDEKNNRMRIISPITREDSLSETEKQKLLEANFHTALDARYAIANDYLWAAYIHPLKELNKAQVLDAISQVYTAALTFGTTYNSTGLSFPGNKDKKDDPNENNKPKNVKKI